MAPTIQALGIDQLSRDERIELVQEIWDSIASEYSTASLLSEPQLAELRKRVADDDAHPDDAVPWEQVHDYLWSPHLPDLGWDHKIKVAGNSV